MSGERAGNDVKRVVRPMHLRAWPKPRKRAPLAILYRLGTANYGVLRNDRRSPLRWNLAIGRYVTATMPNVEDDPVYAALFGGDS